MRLVVKVQEAEGENQEPLIATKRVSVQCFTNHCHATRHLTCESMYEVCTLCIGLQIAVQEPQALWIGRPQTRTPV